MVMVIDDINMGNVMSPLLYAIDWSRKLEESKLEEVIPLGTTRRQEAKQSQRPDRILSVDYGASSYRIRILNHYLRQDAQDAFALKGGSVLRALNHKLLPISSEAEYEC